VCLLILCTCFIHSIMFPDFGQMKWNLHNISFHISNYVGYFITFVLHASCLILPLSFSKSKGEAFLTEGLQVLTSFIFNFMKNSPLKFEIQILILIFIHALYQMVNGLFFMAINECSSQKSKYFYFYCFINSTKNIKNKRKMRTANRPIF